MGRGFDEINKEFTLSVLKREVLKKLPDEKQHCTVAFTPNINVKITQQSVDKKINVRPITCGSNISRTQERKFIQHKKNGVYWTRSCSILLFYHRYDSAT